jgi:hypothetical protein
VRIRGEDLGESVTHLQVAVEGHSLWNCSIKSHQEARIVAVMLGHGRVVKMLKSSLVHLIIDTASVSVL